MRLHPRQRRLALALALLLAFVALALAGYRIWRTQWLAAQVLDSGGPLRPLQAAYDVRRYDLAFRVDPERRFLTGRGRTTALALAPLDRFEIQLDDRLRIASAAVDGQSAPFVHERGLVTVTLAATWQKGERHTVELVYGGKPKVAVAPPWLDGFVWETTASGKPWVAVSVQGDGADDWWPAKDHPSDEPDEGIAIDLTVPAGLVGLSNGHEVARRTNDDGSVTSRWESRHPINNYLVTINLGPYVAIEERYRGADGTLDLPMTFYALPEHLPAARALWREGPAILASFARRFGEFPFLDDKIAVVDAPMSGMEHQTLIAYGDDFQVDDSGIDETLVHELAHEWWGNKISVGEWDDFWIQEGLATYAEVLYVEEKLGAKSARDYLERLRGELENETPLVAGHPRTAAEAYSGDLYNKGAWVMATLRWALGDEEFFRLLRRFADEPADACRLVDTAELERLAFALSGVRLDRFWWRYLRQAKLPLVSVERRSLLHRDEVSFAWDDPELELALPVEVAGELRRIEMPHGRATLTVAPGTPVVLALAGRVLAEQAMTDIER